MSDSLATLWTIACQSLLSMGCPRQEYWSGLPFPSPGDLADPGIEPASPELTGRFFYHGAACKALSATKCKLVNSSKFYLPYKIVLLDYFLSSKRSTSMII